MLSYRAKLLLSHAGLTLGVLLVTGGLLRESLTSALQNALGARLERQARASAQWVDEGRRRYPDRLAKRLSRVVEAEVSIYDGDGRLLGDSEGSRPGGRSEAPEINAARQGNVGRATRVVKGDRVQFVAIPTQSGQVLRLGAPLDSLLWTTAIVSREFLIALTSSVVTAVLLALLLARVTARPLSAMTRAALQVADGDYEVVLPPPGNDEVGRLSSALSRMTAQLADRLQRLNALLERRRELVGNVAHELRTPIAAIRTSVETLGDPALSETDRTRFIATAKRQTARIANLAEQLLLLDELEQGIARPSSERVNLVALAMGVVSDLTHQGILEQTQISLDDAPLSASSDTPVSGPWVLADPDGLERILLNLIENAAKYGAERIDLRLSTQSEHLTLEVRDDGPGINPEDLEHVFERFFRVDRGRARTSSVATSGAGLGLAIVKHSAEAMGAEVWATSDIGLGSSFFLRLKLATEAMESETAPS